MRVRFQRGRELLSICGLLSMPDRYLRILAPVSDLWQSLAKAIAQAIRSDDEKHPLGGVTVPVYAETGLLLVEAPCPQLRKRSLRICDLEEAALLRRITATLS